MDFAWDPVVEALRAEVREFLAEHLTPELEERLYRSGVSHDDEFVRALGARNWIAPEWSREGFEALDVPSVHAVLDELTKADAPMYAVGTSLMVARVIRAVGSAELPRDDRAQGGHRRSHHRPGHERTRGGLRRRQRADEGPPRRRGVGDRRTEDVHHERPRLRLRLPPGPNRPGQRASPRVDDVPRPPRPRRLRGPSRLHHVRRADEHHVLQRALH